MKSVELETKMLEADIVYVLRWQLALGIPL